MHGIGHSIWFLAAWTRFGAGVREGPWILPGDVTIRSPLGKVWGLVALLAMVAFVAAAVALLGQATAWRPLTNVGVVLSFIAVVPWLRQSPGSTAVMATTANLVLMSLLALPLSVDLTAA
jgi:hypothetical protein